MKKQYFSVGCHKCNSKIRLIKEQNVKGFLRNPGLKTSFGNNRSYGDIWF